MSAVQTVFFDRFKRRGKRSWRAINWYSTTIILSFSFFFLLSSFFFLLSSFFFLLSSFFFLLSSFFFLLTSFFFLLSSFFFLLSSLLDYKTPTKKVTKTKKKKSLFAEKQIVFIKQGHKSQCNAFICNKIPFQSSHLKLKLQLGIFL
jgi:hypothetical protein